MKIKIGYLYYDYLNLYGENGNIKFLKETLERSGVEVKVNLLSFKNKFKFSDYDLVYIGSGTEENQIMVLEHLKQYQKEIKKYISQNKFFLATGNSIDMFGKSVILNSKKYDGLNIFSYNSISLSKRIVSEVIVSSPLIDKPLIGFINQNNEIKNNIHALFEIVYSSNWDIKNEGIHYKNFYGTNLLGPILARNPAFAEYFIKKLLKTKVSIDLNTEKLAYDDYIEKNYSEILKKTT